MTPKRHTKRDIKNQKRKSTPNSKVKNNARKRLSVNMRKRRIKGLRRKSNKSIQKPQAALENLKRSFINEYATNLQPVPAGEVFQCMSHSNKNRIVSNQRRSLRNCTNDYVIAPTENFHSCRKFTTNERVRGLSIEVSMEANKLDEKVSRDLQSLNLDDVVNVQNNNNLKVASKSDENDKKSNTDVTPINLFNNASVIEISDSSDVKDSITPRNEILSDVENNDVICLDDTQSNNDDSDVIFIGSKRKPVFKLGNIPKRRKTDDSVIVIDDDEVPLKKSNKKRIRRRGNKTKARMKERIIRSSLSLNQNSFLNRFLATSTPNKVTPETHNGIKCLCIGSHSCAAKPNLATIPEEQGDKRNNKPLNSVNENIQNSLERTSSLLEYNNLDMLGGNFLSAGPIRTQGLRPIFIDGSNIAMGHSNGRIFSVKGLKICIDYFLKRGHEVTAIVPMYRKKRSQNSDPGLLKKLENRGLVVFTPARTVKGRHIVPYDDRYLVLTAAVHQGIVVSSDNFKDLLVENPQMAETIERRVLNPTWIKDMIIFPVDPLGRNGPSLNEFLQFP